MASPPRTAESSNADGNLSANAYVPITQGHTDIAIRENGARLKINAPGRVPFQQVYLWNDAEPDDDAESWMVGKYDPEKHFVDKDKASRLPGPLEKAHHTNAMKYLEFGVVYGPDPGRDKVHGRRKGESEEARKVPGDRDDDYLRAYVRMTEDIPDQTRYYVGVCPFKGRLWTAWINLADVFVYSEFFPSGSFDIGRNTQRSAMMKAAIKKAASRTGKSAAISTVATVRDAERLTASNPLSVTPTESLTGHLQAQWEHFEQTGDPAYVDAMLKLVDGAAPDVKNGPRISDRGLASFLRYNIPEDPDSESVMEPGEGALCAQELQVCALRLTRSKTKSLTIMQTAHCAMPLLDGAMIESVQEVRFDNPEVLGKKVPRIHAAYFLELCHLSGIQSDWDKTVMKDVLISLLPMLDLHDRHLKIQTGSIHYFDESHYVRVLSMSRDSLKLAVQRMDDDCARLAEQHGGKWNKGSLVDLGKKAAAAVDVQTQQVISQQVFAMHGAQGVGALRDMREQIAKLVDMIEKVLSRVGKPVL